MVQRIKLTILAFVFTTMLGLSPLPAFGAGGTSSGGGDPFAAHFGSTARNLGMVFFSLCFDPQAPKVPCDHVKEFNSYLEPMVPILPRDKVVGPDGKPRFAVTIAGQSTELDTLKWVELLKNPNPAEGLRLVAHEFFIHAGAESSDSYAYTSALLALLRKSSINMRALLEPDTHQVAAVWTDASTGDGYVVSTQPMPYANAIEFCVEASEHSGGKFEVAKMADLHKAIPNSCRPSGGVLILNLADPSIQSLGYSYSTFWSSENEDIFYKSIGGRQSTFNMVKGWEVNVWRLALNGDYCSLDGGNAGSRVLSYDTKPGEVGVGTAARVVCVHHGQSKVTSILTH